MYLLISTGPSIFKSELTVLPKCTHIIDPSNLGLLHSYH